MRLCDSTPARQGEPCCGHPRRAESRGGSAGENAGAGGQRGERAGLYFVQKKKEGVMKQYLALYRENRPETFSQVLGQEHIVKILRHQIATDTVAHAYLFCGTRGTGKTTMARILAKAVNCTGESGEKPCGVCDTCRDIAAGRYVDVVEIDAASNNGVENVRDLRESVNYPPVVGRKKVYIIDEVHMMSTNAFNAFLKTLEEPPADVIFILATTDPEKLPPTILSRCMRLDFKRVSGREIRENMRRICAAHGVEITEDALALLAMNADGSVRDSLSLLEQCMSSGEPLLDRDVVLEFLGAASVEFYADLTERALEHDVAGALLLLEEALQEGKDIRQLMRGWMEHYRSLLIAKFVKEPQDMLNMSLENIDLLKQQAGRIRLEALNRNIVTLARTISDARYSTQARILMEVAIVTIAEDMEYAGRAGTQTGGAAAQPRRAAEAGRTSGGAAAGHDMRSRGTKTGSPGRSASPRAPRQETPAAENSRLPKSAAETAVGAGQAAESVNTPAPVDSSDGLDEIWRDVCEADGLDQLSAGATMRGARLAAMNDREFKLIVTGDMVRRMLERNSEQICDLMEQRTGRRRKMVVREMNQTENRSKDERLQQAASEAASILGTKVDIR
ncbi:DNA polymerase III, subunit gamma and tau [Hornefia porci]|uniref:DNA-directed DNA polymerase n=1 Tax=Hornefia porci TaxID=2652292 RepID=A0A1Q9JHQ5_9FIRM|nr:DNA polymerase III subunit gamma/tau [Hornefia porci]OLR55730.1 DNA polymerase III, subunit gamma and tau [Hornefia porci]